MRVLFVCIHNSARSQMAEELMRKMCPGLHVESAGLTPGVLNPLAVEVLREDGIDIEGKPTKDVFELVRNGVWFTHVITVCDETSAERCPVVPGAMERLHWSLPDPSGFTGSWEEKLARTREVKASIKEKLAAWCETHCAPTAKATAAEATTAEATA